MYRGGGDGGGGGGGDGGGGGGDGGGGGGEGGGGEGGGGEHPMPYDTQKSIPPANTDGVWKNVHALSKATNKKSFAFIQLVCVSLLPRMNDKKQNIERQ